MWTVIYARGNEIRTLGRFPTEGEANDAARQGQDDGTFDVADQDICLIDPTGRVSSFSMAELGVE